MCARKLLAGINDLPGNTARSQLIQTHPRYADVSVPVWSNIDGLGPLATGHYDFVVEATTRNPSAGPFCDEFKESGYDAHLKGRWLPFAGPPTTA